MIFMHSQPWHDFFMVTAEAAATLTGLAFIAVSINLSKILNTVGLTSLASEALVQLLGAFFVSCLPLIPFQSERALGIEITVMATALWSIETYLQVVYLRRRSGHPVTWALRRILRTQLSCVPLIAAGCACLRNTPSALFWLLPGLLFSFIGGVANAWVLLIESVR